MAQLKKGELGRVRDTNDWGESTHKGGGVTGYNADNPKRPNEPKQKIAGPGAAVKTPYTEPSQDEIMDPKIDVKGTGKEEARIDHGYKTLDAALKDCKTDF